MVSKTRRVPPRANPEPQATPVANQSVAVPWGQIILTTAATTLVGYVILEAAKAVHASVRRRRQEREKEQMADEMALSDTNPPPGRRPDGTFRLPRPSDYGPRPTQRVPSAPPVPAPPSRPHVYDVSTPVGQLRHEMQVVDDRLARIERLLVGQAPQSAQEAA